LNNRIFNNYETITKGVNTYNGYTRWRRMSENTAIFEEIMTENFPKLMSVTKL
jgi:hypothetical protein